MELTDSGSLRPMRNHVLSFQMIAGEAIEELTIRWMRGTVSVEPPAGISFSLRGEHSYRNEYSLRTDVSSEKHSGSATRCGS